MGASCGRVLHTLEELVDGSPNSSFVTPNRPLCLWNESPTHQEPEDTWGRSVAYCKTSNKTLHKASEEQYNNEDETKRAADVWNAFCESQWPDVKVEERQEEVDYTAAATSLFSTDDWDNSESYANAALL